MSSPETALKSPVVLRLEPGTYWWCACNRSKNQPWCDGSHKGTEFRPSRVDIDAPGMHAMCGCKQSAKAPFCDGTHSKL